MSTSQQIAVMQHLTQGAAAWLVALSSRTFRDTDCTRNSDLSYDGRAVCDWSAKRASSELELLGGDCPSLERFRSARANLAELDLQQRRGELIARDEIRSALAGLANLLRRLGEKLSKHHGPVAAELLTDTLAEFQCGIEQQFGATTGDPESNGHKPE